MNITLFLDDKLVKQLRKLATGRGATLNSLVREYLEKLVAENAISGRKRCEIETLQRSFKRFHRKLDFGKRTWKRQDLYERS